MPRELDYTMHVISRKKLVNFCYEYPDAKVSLEAWFHEAISANWKNSAQIKEQFKSASIISADRVVFNICGNKFRLVVRINYVNSTVFIRFIGTHAQYDTIDAGEI